MGTDPYTPNFHHKTVRTSFAEKLANLEAAGFSATKPKQIYADKLAELIGPSSHKVGRYIRDHCLIKDSNYKVSGINAATNQQERGYPISYLLNAVGLARLKAMLREAGGTDMLTTASKSALDKRLGRAAQKHAAELQCHEYTFKDSSDRLHHPLQHIPRADKPIFWARAGLKFNYDIEACAPNLLHQLAQRHDMNWLLLEPIKQYVEDKKAMRQRVAKILDVDYQHAKQIVNSLFNGARLQASPQCSLYRALPGTPREKREKIEALKADMEVRNLVREIRHMWSWLARKMDSKLTKSTAKWGVYFHLERQVLDVICEYLKEKGVKFFPEHDGFRTDRQIDREDLSLRILDRTGFKLKLKEEVAGDQQASNYSICL